MNDDRDRSQLWLSRWTHWASSQDLTDDDGRGVGLVEASKKKHAAESIMSEGQGQGQVSGVKQNRSCSQAIESLSRVNCII